MSVLAPRVSLGNIMDRGRREDEQSAYTAGENDDRIGLKDIQALWAMGNPTSVERCTPSRRTRESWACQGGDCEDKQTNKLSGLSPRANHTDRATAACRRT
jgi:hypothetical protein